MTVELGHYALILAALVALVQGVMPLAGTLRGNVQWQSMARPMAALQFGLLTLAFAALFQAFLSNDFSVLYVTQHSNSKLPAIYRFAAVWGGHEGSLLLWVWLLALWTVAVATFSRSLPLAMVARVISVLGIVSTGFLLFVLTTSNPFLRVLPAAADGRDLNPLLQDPGLIIHPPMLYMGYVGFSVAFAFAIAALLSGRLDAAWARWSRPWTIVAWSFLTFGIGLGSWWAYYELGWGGWWFWDPVENASLMPWLCGTALIHSLMVTEKRGGFKAWTVLLAIGAFSLSLLGTFLVRSGVLTSVHAFAADPKRGVFILVFLVLVVGASLTLFAWRAPKVSVGSAMGVVSRESMLLANSVLLVVACGAVLLGTLYPLVVDALNLGKLSVGAPYFNAVFVPLLVPVLFLMIPGSVAHWKEARLADIARAVRWPAIAAVLAGALLPFAFGAWSFSAALGLLLATWVAVGSLQQVLIRWSKPGRIPSSFWGMHLAHIGIAVVATGITLVKSYEVERDVRMGLNDTVEIGQYSFKLLDVTQVPGPNYTAMRGEVEVSRAGTVVTRLQPEKRAYFSSAMPMTEASIDSGLLRDLYVSLGEEIDGEPRSWSVRVYYKPFIGWIWAGVLMMAAGGLLAAADRRYRRQQAKSAQSAQTAHGAAAQGVLA